MTSLSIALAAVIHVGVALTSKCGLLNVTHTAAVVQVPMSRTNPGSSARTNPAAMKHDHHPPDIKNHMNKGPTLSF